VKALGLGSILILTLTFSALLDPETGVGIWQELREDLAEANARVDQLVRENDALRGEIEMTRVDPAAVDRAIREELDLALPGEVVVRFLAPAAGRTAPGH
jgi:cell division protein FtsB